ncbi:MAG TPA: glycosyltransferase family 39 protein [Victivallales bacterium]|nr:glycosyltransferase family 39 protein [Victivallales bacterium]
MRYEEKSPHKIISIVIIVIAFIVLYSPWHLGLRELLGEEGKFAAMALDMNIFNPSTIAHGETLSNCFPLYPWVAAIVYKLGFGLEVGLRGISVVCLATLGVIVFQTSKKNSGFQEAVVSTVFMIANIVVFEKAIDGNPFLLAVIFLFLGWLTWYEYGAIQGNWNKAWVVSFIFCGLAFYTIGWIAIFYYFLPLIFMRRPLTLWKKLDNNGFKFGIFIVAFFILLWLIPRLITAIEYPLNSTPLDLQITNDYIIQIIFFPITFATEIIPWTIIVWPAFCVAYYPLDHNPIFSRFLRTISISLFAFLWINPFTETRDFMILVPPLAVLAGVHYKILIRRYGFTLHKLLNFLTIILLVLSIMAFILFLLPKTWWSESSILNYIHNVFFTEGIRFFFTLSTWGIIQTGASVLIGITTIVLHKIKLSVWLHGLCVCLMFMLCFWAVTYPYRSQSNDARVTAKSIIKPMGKTYNTDITLYKGPEIADIYVLGCYLHCHLKKIYKYSELPKNTETVYVLSLNQPVFPSRQWTLISSQYYKNKMLYLWKGVSVNKKPILEI